MDTGPLYVKLALHALSIVTSDIGIQDHVERLSARTDERTDPRVTQLDALQHLAKVGVVQTEGS